VGYEYLIRADFLALPTCECQDRTPDGVNAPYKAFSRVTASTGIIELRTAYRAPKQTAVCERFLGSVRRECLDQLLVLGEYCAYFNTHRPHQGLAQRLPVVPDAAWVGAEEGGGVRATPILGGLHHTYARAA
jgi:putative transposase